MHNVVAGKPVADGHVLVDCLGGVFDKGLVDFAKEDDLKQIVELPALSLSVSAGLIATTMGKYTKNPADNDSSYK